jgi:hypothetical protein
MFAMGIAGAGAFLEALGHVLHGSAHTLEHVICRKNAFGKDEFLAVIRTDTIMTALRGSADTTYRKTLTEADAAKLSCKIVPIVPIASFGDKNLVHTDTHVILPLNNEGFVVFTDGRVYDREKGKFHTGHSTEIVDWAKVRPSFTRRIQWLLKSPSVLIRLVLALILSATIDAGLYYLGDKHGYKKALRGQMPLGSQPISSGGLKSNSTSLLMANALSPIPLSLAPLTASTTKNEYVIPNARLSQAIQRAAQTNQLNQQGLSAPLAAMNSGLLTPQQASNLALFANSQQNPQGTYPTFIA